MSNLWNSSKTPHHSDELNYSKLCKYYMQDGNFSHIITYLTTLLIFYYGLVITEKSKHTVFKLISISVSSSNELSQSGFCWLVGFCYQTSKHCQWPHQCDTRYKQEHRSCSDSSSSPGATLTHRTPPTQTNS